MHGTTTINIDYYEELKRKADAYDAIKKGVIVEWDGGMYIPFVKIVSTIR